MTTESTPYEAVIADLEAKRDRLTGIIDALKQLKEIGLPVTTLSAMAGAATAAIASSISHDSFFGMKIPDAARKYLSMVKGTKPHPELCDALLEGGFQTSATNFREVVRSTLGRHPDFVKIKGQWGLREWYGNRGSGRKTKRTAQVEASDSDSDSSSSSDSSSDSDMNEGAVK